MTRLRDWNVDGGGRGVTTKQIESRWLGWCDMSPLACPHFIHRFCPSIFSQVLGAHLFAFSACLLACKRRIMAPHLTGVECGRPREGRQRHPRSCVSRPPEIQDTSAGSLGHPSCRPRHDSQTRDGGDSWKEAAIDRNRNGGHRRHTQLALPLCAFALRSSACQHRSSQACGSPRSAQGNPGTPRGHPDEPEDPPRGPPRKPRNTPGIHSNSPGIPQGRLRHPSFPNECPSGSSYG